MDISGCILWLDAGQEDYQNGQLVDVWHDRSDVGNHVTQDSDILKPSFTKNIEGNTAVYFDNTTRYLLGNNLGPAISSGINIFAVIKASAGSERLIIGQQYSTSFEFGFYNADVHVNAKEGDTYYPHLLSAGGGVVLNEWTLISWSHDSVSGDNLARVKGVLKNSVTKSGALGTDTLQLLIGARPSYEPIAFHGYMAEILVYAGRALRDYERQNVEHYLKNKHNLW